MYFDAKEFGKRLQEQRKRAGMTQEELAKIIGLSSKAHLCRIERGEKTCSIDLLIALSEALHVSTDYLLKGKAGSDNLTKDKLITLVSQLNQIVESL